MRRHVSQPRRVVAAMTAASSLSPIHFTASDPASKPAMLVSWFAQSRVHNRNRFTRAPNHLRWSTSQPPTTTLTGLVRPKCHHPVSCSGSGTIAEGLFPPPAPSNLTCRSSFSPIWPNMPVKLSSNVQFLAALVPLTETMPPLLSSLTQGGRECGDSEIQG